MYKCTICSHWWNCRFHTVSYYHLIILLLVWYRFSITRNNPVITIIYRGGFRKSDLLGGVSHHFWYNSYIDDSVYIIIYKVGCDLTQNENHIKDQSLEKFCPLYLLADVYYDKH